MQSFSLASNRSAHFGIRKQIITKLLATDSIVNTEKGTGVLVTIEYQRMNECRAKIKYVGEFCRLKIHLLASQREKKNTL